MYGGRGGAKSWAAARAYHPRFAASYSSSALVKLKTPRVLAEIPLCQLMVKGGLVALAGGSRPRWGEGILVCLRLPPWGAWSIMGP